MGYVKDGAKGLGAGLIVTIVLLAVMALIGGIVWIYGVATSGIKGQGDAIKINNSAQNWTEKQGMFEDKYAGIVAYDKEITRYAVQLAEDPKDRMTKELHNGVTAACVMEVKEYNAESRKFLSQDWKSIDLPAQITESDPATDCK
jgi:hypothetical protein